MLKWFEDPAVLKKNRIRLGLSQTDLALRAGVNRFLIGNIERGRRKFTKDLQEILWEAISEAEISNRGGLGKLAHLQRPEREGGDKPELDASREHLQRGFLSSILQPSISLSSLLGANVFMENTEITPELSKHKEALDRERINILEKQIETMQRIITIQEELIVKCSTGESLSVEAAKKDIEMGALKQRMKDLEEMCNIGSQAVAATARYEELREKVQKPVLVIGEKAE